MIYRTITTFRVIFLIILLILGVTSASQARQFRLMTPIASPQEPNAQLPDGVMPVENVQPVPRAVVETLVKELIEKWNTPEMASTLSEQFYDKSRFLDVVATGVPRDATLRIQAIRGIQTLQQYIAPNPEKGRNEVVSIVSATVLTQLEFNTGTGFTRFPGTNEFILKITTAAPP